MYNPLKELPIDRETLEDLKRLKEGEIKIVVHYDEDEDCYREYRLELLDEYNYITIPQGTLSKEEWSNILKGEQK